MSWEFENGRPIYTQIMEQILLRIVSGGYQAGEKLPSVRELAAEAGVNPNTMQKALAELERDGIVFVQRTSGRFITDNPELIAQIRKQLAQKQATLFLESMKQLGFTRQDAIGVLENMLKEES